MKIELSSDVYRYFYLSHDWWIATATKNLTEEEINWQPPGKANTIRWLLQHVTKYLFHLMETSVGGNHKTPFEPQSGKNAPVESVVNHLQSMYKDLISQLTSLSTQDLLKEQIDQKEKVSPLGEHVRITLDHCIGHLAQVSLLRAMYKRMP
ncbi:MAG: DinB family protein [Candidatus Ranarchaeia archaeon]|jgi:hypothetical protein